MLARAARVLSLRTLSVSEGPRAAGLLLRGGAPFPPYPERMRRASGRWSSGPRGPSLRSGHGREGPRAVEVLLRGGAPPPEVLHFVEDTGAEGLGRWARWPARLVTGVRDTAADRLRPL